MFVCAIVSRRAVNLPFPRANAQRKREVKHSWIFVVVYWSLRNSCMCGIEQSPLFRSGVKEMHQELQLNAGAVLCER